MDIDALECPECRARDFSEHDSGLICRACGTGFPVRHGIINTLVRPSAEVVRELQGMVDENRDRFGSIEEFILQRVPAVSTMEERKARTRDDPRDYYGGTEMNFRQAVELLPLTGRETVLEIGGHDDYPFLRPFRDKGCRCYETNIYFVSDDSEEYRNWPVKVIGDMNRLPFRDGHFDVVITSATTHHSPDLEATVREIARVTRRGGRIVIVNEPTHGIFKHVWDAVSDDFRQGGGRHHLIHENEYSALEYRRLFRKFGLEITDWLFPRFYERKLEARNIGGVRFGPLARLVSRLWRVPAFRRLMTGPGLRAGQWLIGMQMNVLLRKR